MFPVVECNSIMRALRSYGQRQEMQNTENARILLGKTGKVLGTRLGALGTSSFHTDPPIPPFEPVPFTLPASHPALRPETSRGTNLVGLRPLRLGLVDASLQDLRNRRALFALQPRSNHLFPRIAFVTRFLLIAGQLHQLWRVKPPGATDSYLALASAYSWSRTSPRPSMSIRPHTTGQKRRPPVSSRR